MAIPQPSGVTHQGQGLFFVPITQGAPGTTLLVAAVAGMRIKVANYVVVVGGIGSFKFVDDSGDLTGAMPVGINGGVSAPGQASSTWFATGVNKGLSIVTTGGIAYGHLSYVLEA